MTSESDNHRLALRKQIHLAGHDFFESLSDIPELQNVAGEFMAMNEDWCIIHPYTVGFDERTKSGFSQNQKHFIERLKKQLEAK